MRSDNIHVDLLFIYVTCMWKDPYFFRISTNLFTVYISLVATEMRRLSTSDDIDTDEECRYRALNLSALNDSPLGTPPPRGVDQFQKREGGDIALTSQFGYSTATVNSDVQRSTERSPSRFIYGVTGGGVATRCGSARSPKGSGGGGMTSCCETRDGTGRTSGGGGVGGGSGGRMRALYNSNRHALFEHSVRTKRRSIKMLFVVVLEFFVCWTPVYVTQTWKIFDDVGASHNVSAGTMNLIHLLAFCSSCSNPITYCFMSKRFRQCFIGVFGRCRCRTNNRRGVVEGSVWNRGPVEYRARYQLPPHHWESNRVQQRPRFDSWTVYIVSRALGY